MSPTSFSLSRHVSTCAIVPISRWATPWVLLLLFVFPVPLVSATLVVTGTDSSETAGDGVCSLREAINNANTNADGSGGDCPPGDDADQGGDTVVLTADVTLSEVAVSNQYGGAGLPPIRSRIRIDGNGFTIARDPGAEEFRILGLSSEGELMLENARIEGGDIDDQREDGGGIFAAEFSKLTLTDVTVSGNRARNGGGIHLGRLSDAVLVRTLLSNNHATLDGGGLGSERDPVVGRLAFVTVTDSTISSNVAERSGGGLGTKGAVVEMAHTLIERNQSGAGGGGLYVQGGGLLLASSTLANNTCSGNGGGILIENSPPRGMRVRNSTFSGNFSGSFGGAIAIIKAIDKMMAVDQSTFVNNGSDEPEPTQFGGGCGFGAFCELEIRSSLLLGVPCGLLDIEDRGQNFTDQADCPGAMASLDIDVDSELTDNGGPTPTHALPLGSAAIDAGGDCRVVLDQRGEPRDDGRCDSGAYEFVE